jgi:Tfp pilus assembly protein PilW
MLMRRFGKIDRESGYTLIELMVALAAGMVVFAGLTLVVMTTMHQSTRTQNRVHATQEARLVLQRIVSDLHSACVASEVAPVQPASGANSIAYVYQTGSGAALTPVLHEVVLSGTSLNMLTYPATSGSTPSWTFSSTPSASRTLMTNVAPAATGAAVFSYYAYGSGGVISSTPLTTPLSTTNAAKTVQVNIALKVNTKNAPNPDPKGGAIVQNQAFLRFSPPASNATTSNLPCE